MPILDIQRRMREIGRIRIGEQVPAKNKKGEDTTRPVKLDKFRLTSQDERVIAAAAAAYGGEPRRWENAPDGEQWEVYTDSKAIDVIVPPVSYAFTQWMELWSGGGCQRRCDGQTEQITDSPCICDPDDPECKPHSRLSLILADLEGFGVWRLDTQGWNAAQELSGTIDVLEMLQGRGQMVPARLLLVQRQSRKPGEAVKKFAVPSLDLNLRVAEMLGASQPSNPAIATQRPVLTPVVSDDTPAPSIAAQVQSAQAPPERAARSNAAAALPPSGRKRTNATNEATEPVDPDAMTQPQINKCRAMFNGHDIRSDEDVHAMTGTILGRKITSLKQVRKAEADTLFKGIEKLGTAVSA